MPDARKVYEAMGILLAKTKEKAPFMTASPLEVYLPGPSPDQLTQEEREKLAELGVNWDARFSSWHCFV